MGRFFVKSFIFSVVISLQITLNITFAETKESSENFLVITDVHLALNSKRPMVIAPIFYNTKNDLDLADFEQMLKVISDQINSKIIPKPKFILLLGDLAGHKYVSKRSRQSVLNEEITILKNVNKSFSPIPIFNVFGNNDSLDGNYGTFFSAARHSGWRNDFLSNGIQCKAGRHTFPCLMEANRNFGYFTAYIEPKIKLIALNSVLFSRNRIHTAELDAQNEIFWLDEQLRLAKKQNESVMIAAHIPIGNNIFDHVPFMKSRDQKALLKIIAEYKDNIIGILTAHTHMEELKIIQNNHHENINAAFFTGGLSTSHGNLPALKTFYLSKDHKVKRWFLSDYTAYNFNTGPDGKLIFNRLYNYRNYYCEDRRTNNMLHCLNGISWKKMQKYYTAGNQNFSGIVFSPRDIFVPVPD